MTNKQAGKSKSKKDTGEKSNESIAAAVDVNPVAVGGASNNLKLKGSQGDDRLAGGLGDDTLDGKGGNDVLVGGAGDDRIKGGSGDDLIYGGEGNDRIDGGRGADTLEGGAGDDRIKGGAGDDLIYGGEGNDRIDGGSGADTLEGGAGDDRIKGGAGDDHIFAGAGNDFVEGGEGGDIVAGGSGNDIVEGGEGDDTGIYTVQDNLNATDVYEGGEGNDTLQLNLTYGEALDADIAADVAGFAQYVEATANEGGESGEGGDGSGYDFSALGLTASGWENVDVNLINTGPKANGDRGETDEDKSITIDVLSNDRDTDHLDVLSVVQAFVSSGGGSATSVNNQIVYDPGQDFQYLAVDETAEVEVSYTISDIAGATSTATVLVTVTGNNDGPVAIADIGTTDENASITVDVLANDTDVDLSDTHTVDAVSVPAGQGTVAIVGNQVKWSPGTDFDYLAVGESATVIVAYTMSDTHDVASSSSLMLTVTGSNDGPVAADDPDVGSPEPPSTPVPVGEEFQVNTTTSGDQSIPAMDTVSGGGVVVAWFSGGEVHGQRYGSGGTPAGSEFRIDSRGADANSSLDVAGLSGGGFVSSWSSTDGSGFGVYAQRFDASGNKTGSEFLVNTSTSGQQISSEVTGLSDGGFIVVWRSQHSSSPLDVFGQRYDSNGAAIGSEFELSTNKASYQHEPSVTGLSGGGFLATWTSEAQDGSFGGAYGQLYDSSSDKVGSEFQVNTYTAKGQGGTKAVELANGNFVVVWHSHFQDGSAFGVYGRVYNSAGSQLTSEFQVNTYTTDSQQTPNVGALESGGFVVTWNSTGQDGSSRGIYGQRYDSSGNSVGSEFQVNTTTSGEQYAANVATQNDGSFMVVWQSLGQDGSGYGIYGQRFDAGGNPASDPALTTEEGTALVIDDAFLLANDTDIDGDTLTITAVGNSAKGSVSLDGTGDVVFTPDAGFSGDTTFDYTIEDGNGGTDTATVTVTVNETPIPEEGPTIVGNTGIGKLEISRDVIPTGDTQLAGVVSEATLTSDDGIIGNQAGSSGTATVFDDGQWNIDGGNMTIGKFGTATLTVSAGGRVIIDSGNQDPNVAGDFQDLVVGANAGAVGSLTISGTGSLVETRGTQNATRIGLDGGDGTLLVEDGGTLETLFFEVGRNAGSIGNATVTGTGTTLIVSTENGTFPAPGNQDSGFARVGRDGGTGTLRILDGARMEIREGENTNTTTMAPGLQLGRNGSTGDVIIDGLGSMIALTQQNPSTGNSGPGLQLGRAGTGSGTGNMSVRNDGTMLIRGENSTISLGSREGGVGNLTVESGGRAIVDGTTAFGGITIGDAANAFGSVSVSGSGSSLSIAGVDANFVVANEGTGTLIVEAGGLVEVTATGNASQSGSANVGLGIRGGHADVSVQNGGAINVTADQYSQVELLIGLGARNAVQSNGNLTVSNDGSVNVDGAVASLSMVNGSLSVREGGSVTVGNATSDTTVNVGAWNFGDGVTTDAGVEIDGVGSNLQIQGASLAFDVGGGIDANGELVIKNGAEFGISGNYPILYVGTEGASGRLSVESGASASITSVHAYSAMHIGGWNDGVGVLDISGTGSNFTTSTKLFVGFAADGTLNVTDGATANVEGYGGHAGGIGMFASGSGNVTVDGGGSLLAFGGAMSVGESGVGVMSVQNGGTVNVSGGLEVAQQGGSSGALHVSGPGSEVNVGNFAIGVAQGGTGVLSINDGGLVTAASVTLYDDSVMSGNGGTIDGVFALNGGTIEVELRGPQAGAVSGGYDVLTVTGNARLNDGIIDFTFADGFGPQAGDSFHFLTTGGGAAGNLNSLSYAITGLAADFSAAPLLINGAGVTLTAQTAGTSEADTTLFFGSARNDTYDGGAGDDVLRGGGGIDRLAGGIGDDLFVFKDADGSDTFTDFTVGAGSDDVIDLTGSSVASTFADIQARASQIGSDTVIDLGGGDTITLEGVNVSELHVDDFKFTDPGTEVFVNLGSSGNDYVSGIARDSHGNVFLSGFTEGVLGSGGNNGGLDLFVAKYDAVGNEIWVKQLGGTSNDYAIGGVVVDSEDNTYLIALSQGDFNGIPNMGGNDAFLIKFDNHGNQIWTQSLASSGHDTPADIAIDANDNVFVTGETYGSLDGQPNSGIDWFTTKFTSDGDKLWTRLTPGPGSGENESPRGITTDGDGNAYVIGAYEVSHGYENAFLVKYDADGNKLLEKNLNGSYGQGHVALVDGNDLYMGSNQGFGSGNIIFGKYDLDGNAVWTRYHDFGGNDHPWSLAKAADGSIYVAGYTNGCLPGNVNVGGYDIFLLNYDTNGNLLSSETIGTTADEARGAFAPHITFAADGTLYLATDSKGDLGGDANQGGSDVFLMVRPGEVEPAGQTIIGTNGDDFLIGTSGNDTIVGLAGDDTLDGGAGNDTLWGDSENILFSDNFEYTDSPLNHGWSAFDWSTPSHANTTLIQNDEGFRSLQLTNPGIQLTYDFGETSLSDISSISIKFYDEMITGNNWNVGTYLKFDSSSTVTYNMWYNPSNYLYGNSTGLINQVSNISRSFGWHEFEWRVDGGFIDTYIDGTLQADNIFSATTLSSIMLHVDEPSSAIFDDLVVKGVTAGDDLFVFTNGSGQDTIQDFTVGAGSMDRIDLSGFSTVHNYADIQAVASQSGSDTLIDLGSGDSITLLGVNVNDLHQDDFIF